MRIDPFLCLIAALVLASGWAYGGEAVRLWKERAQ
jgi:hypothetical protein